MFEYVAEWHPDERVVTRLAKARCGKEGCKCEDFNGYLLWLAPEGYDRWICIGDIGLQEGTEEDLIESVKEDVSEEQTLTYLIELHRRIALSAGQPWPDTPGEAIHLAQASQFAIKTMPGDVYQAMLTRTDDEINEMRALAEENAEQFIDQMTKAMWN